MVELYKESIELIDKKFNVLFSIDCREFDCDYQILVNLIQQIKRDKFEPADRIVLVHMDTDYYDLLLPCGLLIINVIRIFKEHQLPLYLLLFVTNHYGIEKEFNLLLENHDLNDRPTVIKTLLSTALLCNQFDQPIVDNFDNIEKAGLCMIGAKRSHRVAICNYLKNNNLLDKVALQTNF
jgi:hypothetical protein